MNKYQSAQTSTRLHKFDAVAGDMDYREYERVFSGRMTKLRYKTLDRFCRTNTYSERCHHEHDCCGCMCGQKLSFTYYRNQVKIRLTQSFNY